MKRIIICIILACISIILGAEQLQQTTLPNGMRVVVKSYPANGMVGLFCYIQTGSCYEGKFLGSGISHYVEHLVSGGSTSKRSEQDYYDLSVQMGAEINAGTSYYDTEYHQIVEAEHFSAALKVLAEQVQFCVFDSTEVAREQQVIAKEIIMGHSSPLAKLWDRSNELFYSNSNLRYPIIGLPELFMQISRDDLIEYYQKRYVPNNMVFVVAGEIDPETAIREIEQEFSGFVRRNLEPVALPAEPLVQGTPQVCEELDIQFPQLRMNQIIPACDQKDIYSLDIVLDYLVNRENSPLKKKLLEELKLVNYIYAYTHWQPKSSFGSFTLAFEAKNTADIPKIKEILFNEFAKYRKGFFRQTMIDTQIVRLQAANLLEPKTIDDVCVEIALAMLDYGVPDVSQMEIDIYRQLKPADLNAMVAKYLQPMHKFSYLALPLGESEKLEGASSADNMEASLSKTELGDGLVLIHKENHRQPKVKLDLLLPVSSYYETANNWFQLQMMSKLLLSGSQKYPPEKLANWLEDHYIYPSSDMDEDGIWISFSCLSSDLPEMRKILIDALKNPLFAEAKFNKTRESYSAYFTRLRSDPGSLHDEFLSQAIYSDPRSRLGFAEKMQMLDKLTRADLIEAFKKFFRVEKAYIALVGDLTLSEASQYSRDIYKAISHDPIDAALSAPVLQLRNQTHLQEYGFEEANINIITNAPQTDEADYNVMRVINLLLNNGKKRLHTATRGERDLVYYAYSMSLSNPEFGAYALISQTSREKIPELQRVLEAELDRLMNEPVSQEEIDLAIADYLKQRRSYLTDDSLGSSCLGWEFYGLGYDFLDTASQILGKVSPEEVQRVARKYFGTRDVIISIPSAEVDRMLE